MKRKKWLIIFIAIILILFAFNTIASFYFYHLAIERGPKKFLQDNDDLVVSEETMEEFLEGDWIRWTEEQSFKEMELTSFDGLKLQAYYLPAKKPTNKTVVFAHGYLGNALQMGLFGQYYYEELGFNLLLPNLRGHSKSEGDYYGFGWHDRLDLRDWIEALVAENDEVEVVMHGLSMGASAILMASGEELPENVKAIIADSPYTSVYDLFAYQMKRMFRLPAFPVLPSTSIMTKWKANYSLTEASALKQVDKAEVPVLYISGEADTFVPSEMTTDLYEATKSDAKLMTFPEANHGEASVMYKAEYLEAINGFLSSYQLKN